MADVMLHPGETALGMEVDLQHPSAQAHAYITAEALAAAGVAGHATAEGGRSANIEYTAWLDNGGELKIRSPGNVPTYISAGSPDVADAVASVHAGAAIMYRLAQTAEGTTMYLHAATSIQGNVASMGMPQYHNYDVANSAHAPEAEDLLIARTLAALDTHRATRVWAGGGLVTQHGFVFMQRAAGIGHPSARMMAREANVVVHGARPMSTHQEWGNGGTMVDLAGDPPLSAQVTFADITMTRLVMKMASRREGGVADKLNNLALIDPVSAMHKASTDLTLHQARSECRDGYFRNPLDVQKALMALSFELPEGMLTPGEVRGRHILQKIFTLMQKVKPEQGKVEEAEGTLAWAARLGHVMRQTNRRPALLTDARRAVLEATLGWDQHPNGGSGELMKRTAAQLGLEQRIAELQTSPPDGSLAVRKVAAIHRHRGNVKQVYPDFLELKNNKIVRF